MALVNIPRDVKDEFHRYKMPFLIAKVIIISLFLVSIINLLSLSQVEGRGNGIKTVIVNMADIAKSLDRPPEYVTKFFGFELGALTTIDPAKDRYIVNGKHDQPKLAQALDNFIERFILCKKCVR
jgi:translation initiation factor 5